jgi:coronin-1B/1C/6
LSQHTINFHSGPVIDFGFNPFKDNQIASVGDDGHVNLYNIPDGGLTDNVSEPTVHLGDHSRKSLLVRWNPTTSGILATAGGEGNVKVWDAGASSEVQSFDSDHGDLITDLAWDYFGGQFATTCKDKKVRIFDARSGNCTSTINAHDGSKSAKVLYMGTLDRLFTVGFVKGSSNRQFKIWDPRNSATPLHTHDYGTGAGVVMPFYDQDTNMLYMSAKGEGAVTYYELLPDGPHVLDCAVFRSTVPSKGCCYVPKRALDVTHNETARILKLTTSTVEPLRFFVPRKSEQFQDDLFPATAAGVPSQSAKEWLNGSTKGPMVIDLNPSSDHAARESLVGADSKPSATSGKYVKAKSASDLQKELETANSRIAELEAKLKLNGISY